MTVDGVVTVIDAAAVAAGRFADDPEAVARQRAADPGARPRQSARGGVRRPARLRRSRRSSTRPICSTRRGSRRCAREIAARLRPGVKLVAARARRGSPPAVALGLAAAAEDDLAARPSLHELEGEHDHDDFESFVVSRGPVADADALPRPARARRSARTTCCGSRASSTCPGRERRQVVQAVGDRMQQHFDRALAPARRARPGSS